LQLLVLIITPFARFASIIYSGIKTFCTYSKCYSKLFNGYCHTSAYVWKNILLPRRHNSKLDLRIKLRFFAKHYRCFNILQFNAGSLWLHCLWCLKWRSICCIKRNCQSLRLDRWFLIYFDRLSNWRLRRLLSS